MGHRRGIPLRDRPVDPPSRRADAPPPDPSLLGGRPAPDHPGPWPGVIVEWRRADDGWSALVVYVVTEGSGSTTVETRLPARFLRPAHSS